MGCNFRVQRAVDASGVAVASSALATRLWALGSVSEAVSLGGGFLDRCDRLPRELAHALSLV